MSVRKINSLVSMPLNKANNQLYFDIPEEPGVIDMQASYVELAVNLSNLGTPAYKNVVLGRDGIPYSPSCLFRSSTLKEPMSGKVYQDLVYLNILENNLQYWAKGTNAMKSDALFSGNGVTGYDTSFNSIFSNGYSDDQPILKVPLSVLYPGSLGISMLPTKNGYLEARYLLEPSFKLFQRAVEPVYGGTTSVGNSYAFANVNSTATTITASAVGTVGNFSANQYILVSCTQNSATITLPRKIVSIVADNGVNPGSFTVDSALSASQTSSAITIVGLTNTAPLACADLTTTGATLTLRTSTPANVDLLQGTSVKVTYQSVTSVGVVSSPTVLYTTVSSLTGSPITAVVLPSNLTVPTNGVLTNIIVEPLYTNLDSSDWSIVDAHLIVYRHKMGTDNIPKETLVSTFNSVNIASVGGLNRFMYNMKADANTFNMIALTPSSSNLYSQNEYVAGSSNAFRTYQVLVDDKPLSSIYYDAGNALANVGQSGPHLNNMIRTLTNSNYYLPRNLSQIRDNEMTTQVRPVIFPAKFFKSMNQGEEAVQDFGLPDKNIRIELVADEANGYTTPQKQVYIFFQTYKLV